MSALDDFDVTNVVQRREFLSLLATQNDLLALLSEGLEEDAVPYVIQAMAVELVKTSILVNNDIAEKLEDIEAALDLVGPMMAGLLGFGEESSIEPPEDEDPKVTALHQMSRRTGAPIREGAGLEALRTDPESRADLIEQGWDLVRRLRREADELEQQAKEMEEAAGEVSAEGPGQ
jgi:hypothetical protein